MTDRVVLGIDVGTTETKAGLVALDGRLLGLARARHGIDVDAERGRAEQDSDEWWRAVVSVVHELTARSEAEIVGIGVDGHGPTTTAVDGEGRPVRAAITWLDTRAAAETRELTDATGLKGWALGVLPGALWIERHEPIVAAGTRWYLNTWEALALRLCGRAATSLVPEQPFPVNALAAAGVPAERIAPPVAAGTILGGLTGAAASALGLPAGIPVVAGTVDAFASFHGARMVENGDAIDAGGAAGGFGVYWDVPIPARGSFCTPAPLAGHVIVGGAMAATGKALDWFRDAVVGNGVTTDDLIDEAARVPPGAEGLVFLPYLAGERSPLWDPTARGVFAGLTLNHRRGHLARAILEAAALAIRHVAEPIVAGGARVAAMRVTGGPARSAAWNQLKADVTGFAVEVPHVVETAVMGSAINAATGIGAYPDLPTAIRAMTRIDRRIEPRAEHRETYDRVYAAYVDLYPAVAPIVRALSATATSAPRVLAEAE